MINIRHKFLAATLLLALGATQVASAVVVSDSLGNTAPGFNDGDIPDIFQLGAAQGGQLPPFDTSYGTDIALAGGTGTNFSKDWTHNYGAIAGSIISASITIGIVDHDSSAAGSQLESFSVGGFDYTSDLGTLFETAGHGEEAEYNVYTVSLGGAALFTSLANGSALISLALDGPGQVVGLFGSIATPTNGANLIFSTLTIEYQDSTIPPVPIPAAAPLFLSAIALMGLYRRRVLRNQA